MARMSFGKDMFYVVPREMVGNSPSCFQQRLFSSLQIDRTVARAK